MSETVVEEGKGLPRRCCSSCDTVLVLEMVRD